MEKGNSGRGGEERVPGLIDVYTTQPSQFIYIDAVRHLSVRGCIKWDGCTKFMRGDALASIADIGEGPQQKERYWREVRGVIKFASSDSDTFAS